MTFEDWWEARVKPVNPDPAAKLVAMSAWTFATNQEREACARLVEDLPNDFACYEYRRVCFEATTAIRSRN